MKTREVNQPPDNETAGGRLGGEPDVGPFGSVPADAHLVDSQIPWSRQELEQAVRNFETVLRILCEWSCEERRKQPDDIHGQEDRLARRQLSG